MKLKKWNDFINESFGISTELSKFISQKSPIDWDSVTDSLWELEDIKNLQIKKNSYIEDENGHIINIDLEEDKRYKFRYYILIEYFTQMKGGLDSFYKLEEVLSKIKTSLQEMISRAQEKVVLAKNGYKIEQVDSRLGYGEIKYLFDIQFVSEDFISKEELEKVYNEYKSKSQFTPEFNKGLKELTDIYKRERIELSKFIDYNIQSDVIMVGFVTEDDIYGIGEYDIESKRFDIDRAEIEGSIEWYREEYGFENMEFII